MKNVPKIGQKVRVKEPIEAYYSGYAGNPRVFITPDMVGEVKAVKVPSVSREKIEFCCVDFEVPGVYQGDPKHKYCTWRIGVEHKFLQEV